MTSSSVSLRQVEYFVSVAESGTVAAAAKERLVSQSAISVAISQLEAKLGVDVFHRAPSKRLVLTPAGRQLLVDARRVLSQVEEFTATARHLGESLRGELVVGCAETLTPYILPPILGDFGDEHPGLEVELVEGSVARVRTLMAEAVCEVAITYWPEEVRGFTAIPLYELRPHVILPPMHALAGRATVRLADLADERVILLDSPPSAELFLSMFATAGIVPRTVKRTTNMDTLRALVAGGAGYAPLLNRHGVTQAPNGESFVAAEIAESIDSLGVFVVSTTDSQLTRRAQAFVDFCVRYFGGPTR